MDIVLVTPTPPDINAFGIRIISSVLKKAGFSTKIIFLPGGIEYLRFDSKYIYKYSRKTLEQISDLCESAGIIGFSFMSQYYDRAVQITKHLKECFNIPMIWGGIHPTYRPEECLNFCDAVCIGEGENAVVKFAQKISMGIDYTDTENFVFKLNNGIRENKCGQTIQNLDEVPFVDYDIENHYVYEWRSEDIIPIDEEVMKGQFLKMTYFNDKHLPAYRTMTSRGCPHKCTYCASSAMLKLRRRSIDNVLEELKMIMKRFDYIEIISFFDDTFFAAPITYFEEFRDKYKREIGLPFHAQCSPTTISNKKMELLVDAGLFYTEMGIQTGSDRIRKMYRRVVSDKKIIDASVLINRYSKNMLMPDYHVILDNPWETKEDVLDTLRLLLKLSGRYKLQISSLTFYPGTELNEKAKAEGIIKDEVNEVYRKPFTYPKFTYLNYLIYLSGFPWFPRWILRFVSIDLFVNIFHRQESSVFYRLLFNITRKMILVRKGITSLLKGDFGRITNYFKLVR